MPDEVKEEIKEDKGQGVGDTKLNAKKTEKEQNLEQKNREYYSKKNVKGTNTIKKEYIMPNATKIKIIREIEYKEKPGSTAKKGVIKRSLIGLKKNDKWKIDRGVPKEVKESK